MAELEELAREKSEVARFGEMAWKKFEMVGLGGREQVVGRHKAGGVELEGREQVVERHKAGGAELEEREWIGILSQRVLIVKELPVCRF